MTAEERQKLDFYREKAAKTQGNREKLAKYEKFARNTAEKTRSSKTNAGKVAKISEKSDICVKTPVKVKNSQEIYSKSKEIAIFTRLFPSKGLKIREITWKCKRISKKSAS